MTTKRALHLLITVTAVLFGDALFAAENTLPTHMYLTSAKVMEQFKGPEVVLSRAYEKLGISLSIQYHPNARSLRLSNAGEFDGEVLRSDALQLEYPNLIRVPVPIITVELLLLSTSALPIQRLEDLKHYRIGTIGGILLAENLIDKYGAKQVVRVSTGDRLLTLLERNTVDIIFTSNQLLRQWQAKHPEKKYYRAEVKYALQLFSPRP